VTFEIAIVSVPEIRAPPAMQVRVAVDAAPVRTFAVTETGFSVAEMDGTVVGSESGKLMVATPRVKVARALTVALTVKTLLSVAAKAPPTIQNEQTRKAITKQSFFISISSFRELFHA
jgi:malate/lactate dehydrogenase